MPKKRLASVTEQVIDLLRRGMVEGRWRGVLPGRDRLAAELGCSHWTVEQALRQLIKEGLVVSDGAGKPRRVRQGANQKAVRLLRIRILLYEPSDRKTDYLLEMLTRIRNLGHDAMFADRTLHELGMNAVRVEKYVKKHPADAWIVLAGARDILTWFSKQDTPAFALFGRQTQIDMASVSLSKTESLLEVVDRLFELNHRRIVMIVREERRKPVPGLFERLFLERLEFHGISTGAYNLPDWGDGAEELNRIIGSLFGSTPPTAIIMEEPMVYLGVVQHLASIGLSAPAQVSLFCMDHHHLVDWMLPQVSHIAWDKEPVIKRVVQWVKGVTRGEPDRRKTTSQASLVLGGTIGSAPRARTNTKTNL